MKKLSILFVTIIMAVLFAVSASAEDFTEGYYTYTVENGEAMIVDVDDSISGDIAIPKTLNNYPVVKIGTKAFYYLEKLSKIEIPDSVEEIGNYAFEDCDNLNMIYIPKNVSKIGKGAFSDCDKLEYIYVNKDNQHFINDEYGALYDSEKTSIIQFPAGSEVTSYIIPDTVIIIGDAAFDGCKKIESVTMPNHIDIINSLTFSS